MFVLILHVSSFRYLYIFLVYSKEGNHTMSRTVKTSSLGKLAAFTKKRSTCIGCKAVLDTEGHLLYLIISFAIKCVGHNLISSVECWPSFLFYVAHLSMLSLSLFLVDIVGKMRLCTELQELLCATTARRVNRRSTSERWSNCLHWRRSSLDCGLSASDARAVFTRTFFALGR